jgi:integrase
MSPLRCALADYLTVRRSLGYKLENAERLLRQFLAYLEERGERTIRTEHAVAWATMPGGTPTWHCARLATVRGFAVYLKAIDPACEVPGAELAGARSQRATPYIYSEQELARLLEATATVSTPHHAATYRTLIALLAVTGMRIGEAIRLDQGDLDYKAQLIVVRDTKFGKSRELPLHESTAAALGRYLRRVDRPTAAASTEAVLVSTTGARLRYGCVQWTFARLVGQAGIEARSARCRPRLHDLRHTFAVRTLLDGYREGGAVEGRLAALSTYLGHNDPASTYWYLSAAPELMELAAERLQRHLGDGA